MFYLILSIVFAVIIGCFCMFKFWIFKDKPKFNTVMDKILKILVVIYVVIMLLSVLLPDAFALCYSAEELAAEPARYGYAIIRWFSMVSFVTLPIAVFYKNRTIRNIAIFFGVAITFAQICFYPQYLADFTSTAGRGLNSIPVISQNFKNFLINPTFRSIWFGFVICLQLIIPIMLAIQEKHMFNFKSGKEYLNFFICLPFVIISCVPIYVLQHLFGHSNLIFKAYGIVHFGWLAFVIAEIFVLYFIFRKKDTETKMVLLFVLSLSLIMQYLQMFSAISINIARLPFQLCNLGAFLILISLITKNKKLFNFTMIINVIGVIFALASPDVDNKGLFYLYNMHFILEHTNVLVIPVLALSYGIFPRLDKKALWDCLLGFTIYFVCAWLLGTIFNAIAIKTGNNFWAANYMFMFDVNKAAKLIPFTKALFDIKFNIGRAVVYPVMQLIVYLVFVAVCTLLFFVIQLIYLIKDKIQKNRQKPNDDLPENEKAQKV